MAAKLAKLTMMSSQSVLLRMGLAYAAPDMRPASLTVCGNERLISRHNFLAQRHQGHRDHLDVGDGQRDPNDGDGHGNGRGDVTNDDPNASHQNPDDISQRAGDPGSARLVHDGPAEGPQRIPCDAEGGDAPRDRDDENAAKDASGKVAQGQPETAEHEPNDIQKCLHASILPCQSDNSLRC